MIKQEGILTNYRGGLRGRKKIRGKPGQGTVKGPQKIELGSTALTDGKQGLHPMEESYR